MSAAGESVIESPSMKSSRVSHLQLWSILQLNRPFADSKLPLQTRLRPKAECSDHTSIDGNTVRHRSTEIASYTASVEAANSFTGHSTDHSGCVIKPESTSFRLLGLPVVARSMRWLLKSTAPL